jgi:hypothetical protein
MTVHGSYASIPLQSGRYGVLNRIRQVPFSYLGLEGLVYKIFRGFPKYPKDPG